MKLLAKMAEERYQSAEGLKADLERCREQPAPGAPERFTLGEHDMPSRFQLPQRLYGREAQVAALLQGFERVAATAGPSCSWSAATPASASPRWCTSSTSRWCSGAASS